MDRDTLRFIDRIYKDLYKSPEVLKHSSGNETEKFKNLEEYLNTLESVHERAAQSDERIKTIKRMYYNKYVIKKENIPDSYYENQKRIALERGFGHIEIDEWQRDELQKEVIENQKASLDTWLDYLMSEDAKFYPFWAKYWAFQGMLKMGIYDKDKGSFSKRTNETAAPFVDLNREALAKSIDLVIKMVGKEKIDDRDLEIIVKSGSFPKIYTHILKKILSDNENIIKRDSGVWIKYNQGSDHMPLVNSLQGYNTGWCTAGESTAKSQLAHGDFYVYYTLNEKNEYKVPRIAIRMEGSQIGEIRGIGPNQNIESNMEKVVEEKIKDFPNKDKYYKKVDDMKKLTALYDKFNKGIDFNKEELRFLYEMDDYIEGFGYLKDPRIKEILSPRNIKEDLSKVADCSIENIATSKDELNEKTVCYIGDLYYSHLKKIYGEKIIFPEYVLGDLNLINLNSASGMKLPKYVKRNLILNDLKEAKGLELPIRVGESVSLSRLEKAENVIFPKYVGNDLNLSSVTQIKGCEFPKEVGRYLNMVNVKELIDVEFPKYVGNDCTLTNVEKAVNVIFPEYVAGNFDLVKLKEVSNVKFPDTVGADLLLDSLITVDNVVLPRVVVKSLSMTKLKSAKNLVLPESVFGLFMDKLESLEGITLPKTVNYTFYMPSVQALKDVTFPGEIGYNMVMDGVKTAENVVFPKRVKGNFGTKSLKTAVNVTFPEEIFGTMDLDNLITVENTTFSDTIYGSLKMGSIKKLSNIKFPERIKGSLYLYSLKEAENVVFPKIIKDNLSLWSLVKATNVEFPVSIGYSLEMKKIKKIQNLELEGSIVNINLESLESADNIVFPSTLKGSLYLNSLKKADNIVFPVSIEYVFDMSSIKEIKTLELEGSSKHIFLNSLEKVGTLILPKQVDTLDLNSLTTFDKLVLPETCGNITFKHEQTAEDIKSKGVKLPKLSGLIYTQDFLTNVKIFQAHMDEFINSNKKKID